MVYIESHCELRDHPKTKRLRRQLGCSLPTVIGHLNCLWWWALDYAPNGDLTRFDAADIAEAAEWDGDPDEFIRALLECGLGSGAGFLEHTPSDKLLIHDWHQYGGKLVIKRYRDNFRKQHQRLPTEAELRAAGLFAEKSLLSMDIHANSSGIPAEDAGREEKNRQEDRRAEHHRQEEARRDEPAMVVAPPREKREINRYLLRPSEWEWLRQVPPEQRELADWYEHQFYANHPVRQKPEAGWRALVRLNPSPELRAKILAQQAAFKARDRRWLNGYAPYPDTWINDRGWEGEPLEAKATLTAPMPAARRRETAEEINERVTTRMNALHRLEN
jgi:hypothetical protein